MKNLILLTLLCVSVGSFGQNDCDTTLCTQYAAMNSFEVIGNSQKSEMTGDEPIMISCKMLCAIEEARSAETNVVIQYGTYTILVYREGEEILNEEK